MSAKCEFVEKESSARRGTPIERCDDETAPAGGFCQRHLTIVKHNPKEQARQATLAPNK